MRVSTSQQFETYMAQIQSAQSRFDAAQRQVMTGKKFELASESPGDALFVITAKALLSRTKQLDSNLRSAKDYLGNTETAFDELNTLVTRAYTLAVNGANATYDQSSRDSMASEIAEIQKRIVSLGNTQGANGQYVFSGQKTDTIPFAASPPTLTYNGDDNAINAEIRPNETMRINLTGAGTFFQNLYTDLENLKNDLSSGNLSQTGDQDIRAMQSQMSQINATRGDLGTKLQSISDLADQNTRRIDDLTKQVSDVQEVDLTQAVIDMQSAQTAYQAALQVTAVGHSLSLMDFLK